MVPFPSVELIAYLAFLELASMMEPRRLEGKNHSILNYSEMV